MKEKSMKSFYVLMAGLTASFLGTNLSNFGISLWILDNQKSVVIFTSTAAALALPGILISPLAGTLIDRWSRKKVLAWGQLVSALSTLVLAAFYFYDRLSVELIIFFGAISSIAGAFMLPAISAGTTMMVPKESLPRANSIRTLGFGMGQLLGPAIAGFLIVSIDLAGIFVIDLLSFCIGFAAVLLVKIPPPPPDDQENSRDGSVWQQMSFAWSYLRERKGLFWLMFFYAALNFIVASIYVLFMPLLRSFASPEQIGLLMSVGGVGMIGGSAFILFWRGFNNKVLIVLGLSASISVAIMLTPIYPSVYLVGIGIFLVMALFPGVTALSQTVWQQKLAPQVQGRIFGFRATIVGATMPVAYLLAGVLVDQVFEPFMELDGPLPSLVRQIYGVGEGRGIALMVSVLGVVSLLVVIAAFFHPRIRRVENELPDYDYSKAAVTDE